MSQLAIRTSPISQKESGVDEGALRPDYVFRAYLFNEVLDGAIGDESPVRVVYGPSDRMMDLTIADVTYPHGSSNPPDGVTLVDHDPKTAIAERIRRIVDERRLPVLGDPRSHFIQVSPGLVHGNPLQPGNIDAIAEQVSEAGERGGADRFTRENLVERAYIARAYPENDAIIHIYDLVRGRTVGVNPCSLDCVHLDTHMRNRYKAIKALLAKNSDEIDRTRDYIKALLGGFCS